MLVVLGSGTRGISDGECLGDRGVVGDHQGGIPVHDDAVRDEGLFLDDQCRGVGRLHAFFGLVAGSGMYLLTDRLVDDER